MKKIRIILAIFVFISCGLLFSCEKEDYKPTPIISEIPEQKDKLEIENKYTSTTLSNGAIEDTVESIYQSVVAIDAYINASLYGSGSGVIFGYNTEMNMSFIVTCHHVIEGCNSFKITLSDSSVYEAKLVGGDSNSDIAVLSVDKVDLCYATWFEDTDTLRLGSGVICIGNPLGTLPGSVSTGVVSYNNRKIKVDDYNYRYLIQTDVAINSGNSGGGLFNLSGALIGIVNAKYSSSGIEGLGFAIPSNQARKIVDDIMRTASYQVEKKEWQTGYVLGRWNLGFSLGYGYGNFGFTRASIGIASAATNPTSSDYNLLLANDRINAITIEYKDSSKATQYLTNITGQTTTIEMVYNFIYSAELSLEDTIIFDITRNGESKKIEVVLKQYCYQI